LNPGDLVAVRYIDANGKPTAVKVDTRPTKAGTKAGKP
jgi:hypothetical protein